jgi:glycerate 2-kinase
MNILIAPDKFKGTMTSPQVCDAIASAILNVHPDWTIEKVPLADGGEGTCEILTSISGGAKVIAKARDPLFRKIETNYGLSPDRKTAFIEMASASGLPLLSREERNPLLTSSVGTGDLIAEALQQGVRKIIIGCGGSATNDGGIGMASALGISFLDENGNELSPIGENLSKIKTIDAHGAMQEISTCQFLLIADVDNPLCGREGASYIFAPQKGATSIAVDQLDRGLYHFASILNITYGTSRNGKVITDFPGAGAAGGFPISARAFLNAQVRNRFHHGVCQHRRENKKC